MIDVLYSFFLVVWVAAMSPKLLFTRKKRQGLLSRIFPEVKPLSAEKTIWIHAVSLGEMRASFPLYQALLAQNPSIRFYISTTTQTGYDTAKSLMKGAEVFFLPLDFSWIMRRLVAKLRPNFVLFLEGDLWFNLLKALKRKNIPAVICSAKMSDKSFRRFSWVPDFASSLFSLPEKILAQTPLFASYFERLGTPKERIHITGNIKESFIPMESEYSQAEELKKRFSIDQQDFLIVIGSTHAAEEAQLAKILAPLLDKYPALCLLFVPRHPERFLEVERLLTAEFQKISVFSKKESKSRVMLLDCTGMLCACFSLAQLAILGGSFVDGIGGHNILEPVMRETPVLFGPYMYDQKGFVEKALAWDVGEQIPLSQVQEAVSLLLKNPSRLNELKKNCLQAQKESSLPLKRTLTLLAAFLKKSC